jgi:hypothetical protein
MTMRRGLFPIQCIFECQLEAAAQHHIELIDILFPEDLIALRRPDFISLAGDPDNHSFGPPIRQTAAHSLTDNQYWLRLNSRILMCLRFSVNRKRLQQEISAESRTGRLR